jgi:hypothetical protein
LDYNGIHCVSIGAIQELDVRLQIDEKKNEEVDRQQQADKVEIAALKTQLTAVLARLDALENPN